MLPPITSVLPPSLTSFIVPVSEEDGEEAELHDIGLLGGELKSDAARESLRTIAPLFSLSWAITSPGLASSSTGKISPTIMIPVTM